MQRCLVVDDSAAIRKIARFFLEDLGCEVSEAETGQQGLERVRRTKPDIIFLDWHLPSMSAMEFLAALRITPVGKRPWIVYCTTENDPVDISRAFAAGAHDVLLKPFDRAMLTSKMSAIAAAA